MRYLVNEALLRLIKPLVALVLGGAALLAHDRADRRARLGAPGAGLLDQRRRLHPAASRPGSSDRAARALAAPRRDAARLDARAARAHRDVLRPLTLRHRVDVRAADAPAASAGRRATTPVG